MNTYQINAAQGCFEIQAADSDIANYIANTEYQRRAGHKPATTERAELLLMLGDGTSESQGHITLATAEVPTTWAETRQLKSDLFTEAKRAAKNDWHLPVIRSRGATLVVVNDIGRTIIFPADCEYLPDTQKDFRARLEQIKAEHPTATRVYLNVSCDSAESLYAMNQGEYQPITGEAEALLYTYPATSTK